MEDLVGLAPGWGTTGFWFLFGVLPKLDPRPLSDDDENAGLGLPIVGFETVEDGFGLIGDKSSLIIGFCLIGVDVNTESLGLLDLEGLGWALELVWVSKAPSLF